MFVGIDDTDSVNGMCTTYLAAKIFRALAIAGLPKLVRLNPNIPYKTRGNGAVAFQTEDLKVREKVLALVKKYSRFEDERTNPGVVFLDSETIPPEIHSFYKRAVSELVSLEDAEKLAESAGVELHKFKNGRGIIGALAALGFVGPKTFEVIAYRLAENNGKKRMIDSASVREMDKALFPSVFDNIGPDGKRVLITPKGRDPIFCGIRGVNQRMVEDAWAMIKPLEPIEMCQVFETNQATDAHLRVKTISQIKPYDCVIVAGEVTSAPRTIRGGHVIFKLSDESGSIDCAAYKPSGAFQNIVKELAVGDTVKAYGGVSKYLSTINLEKVEVLSLRGKFERKPPKCCQKNMTSAGKNKGYKCKKCNKKVSHAGIKISQKERLLTPGVYDSPPGARRHLSRPVYLME
jgi:tRNA(Ile2)-agmatinylcytidine synthase